jgi:hypothetical protein
MVILLALLYGIVGVLWGLMGMYPRVNIQMWKTNLFGKWSFMVRFSNLC